MQRTNYLATATLIAICLSWSHVNSQEYDGPQVGNKKVEIRIVGPFQVAEHDKRLQKFLREPYAFAWDNHTMVSEMARDLSTCVPFLVDQRALEEIGLEADAVVHSEFQGRATKKQKAKKAPPKFPEKNFDPFGPATAVHNTKSSETTTSGTAKQADAAKQLVRWWDTATEVSSPAKRKANQDITNAAMLFHFLDASDLTIHSRAGQWLITTQERAEETPTARLYGVTSIAPGEKVPSTTQPHSGQYGVNGIVTPNSLDNDSLVQSIQTSIAPDTWECLGGPSTLGFITVDGRRWMVVNTTTTVHWRVEAFLNQLAR